MTPRMSNRRLDHHKQVTAGLLRVSMVDLPRGNTVSSRGAMVSNREGMVDLRSHSTASSKEALVSNKEAMVNSKADMVAHLNNSSSMASDLLSRVNRVAMVSSKGVILLKVKVKVATVLPHHLATNLRVVNRNSEGVDCAQMFKLF